MAEQTQVLGTLPINRKEYNPNVFYYKDNIVMYNNCAYYCKVKGPVTNTPPDDSAVWGLWSGNILTQDPGDSLTKVMSQKGTTDYLDSFKVQVRDNKLYYSHKGRDWTEASGFIKSYFRYHNNRIQISEDNEHWSDFSEEFADNLRIKGYVATESALPTSAAQGDIYMVGSQAPYTMFVRNGNQWVNNGEYTSFSAGIEQTLGDNSNSVVSQKVITKELQQNDEKLAISKARVPITWKPYLWYQGAYQKSDKFVSSFKFSNLDKNKTYLIKDTEGNLLPSGTIKVRYTSSDDRYIDRLVSEIHMGDYIGAVIQIDKTAFPNYEGVYLEIPQDVIPIATPSKDGLMSAQDKARLDSSVINSDIELTYSNNKVPPSSKILEKVTTLSVNTIIPSLYDKLKVFFIDRAIFFEGVFIENDNYVSSGIIDVSFFGADNILKVINSNNDPVQISIVRYIKTDGSFIEFRDVDYINPKYNKVVLILNKQETSVDWDNIYIKVPSKVVPLEKAIKLLSDNSNLKILDIQWEVGYYNSNKELISSQGTNHAKLDIEQYVGKTLSGTLRSESLLYNFIEDSNGNTIESFQSKNDHVEHLIPLNAKYLLLSNYSTTVPLSEVCLSINFSKVVNGKFNYTIGGYYDTNLEFVSAGSNVKYCEIDVSSYQGCLLKFNINRLSSVHSGFVDEDGKIIQVIEAVSNGNLGFSNTVFVPIPRAVDLSEWKGENVKGAKYLRVSVLSEISEEYSILTAIDNKSLKGLNIALIGSSNISMYFDKAQCGFSWYMYHLAPLFGYNIIAKGIGGTGYNLPNNTYYNGNAAETTFNAQYERALIELASKTSSSTFDIVVVAGGWNDGLTRFTNDYDKVLKGVINKLNYDVGITTDNTEFTSLSEVTQVAITTLINIISKSPRCKLYLCSNMMDGGYRQALDSSNIIRYIPTKTLWRDTFLKAMCDTFNAKNVDFSNGTTWRAWIEDPGSEHAGYKATLTTDGIHANTPYGGWEMFQFIMSNILQSYCANLL